MFYDKSDGKEWKQIRLQAEDELVEFEDVFSDDEASSDGDEFSFLPNDSGVGEASEAGRKRSGWSPFTRNYDREIIENVWEFAEIVTGVDPVLWRKDEFGEWIHRPDYGKRESKFGWEIFDPGIGRHNQGVYAMRPMQWESYVDQFS